MKTSKREIRHGCSGTTKVSRPEQSKKRFRASPEKCVRYNARISGQRGTKLAAAKHSPSGCHQMTSGAKSLFKISMSLSGNRTRPPYWMMQWEGSLSSPVVSSTSLPRWQPLFTADGVVVVVAMVGYSELSMHMVMMFGVSKISFFVTGCFGCV